MPPDALYPLDLDRAFRKLDTIRESIESWDSDYQAEVFLREERVSLCSAWNREAQQANAAGFPIGIQWDRHLLMAEYLVVPRGTPNRDEAMQLVAYIVSPKAQRRLTARIAYAPVNRGTRPDPTMAPFLASEHLDVPYAVYDEAYYVDHFEELDRAFQQWLNG